MAFILSIGEVVPDDFVLSNTNIAEVQAKMPNRNGMTRKHGFWNVKDKPDVNGSSCMNNCVAFVQIGSTLPDFARDAQEILQTRIVCMVLIEALTRQSRPSPSCPVLRVRV